VISGVGIDVVATCAARVLDAHLNRLEARAFTPGERGECGAELHAAPIPRDHLPLSDATCGGTATFGERAHPDFRALISTPSGFAACDPAG